MVRGLGFMVPYSHIWVDNDGVLLSSTRADSSLKKESTALSFNLIWEAVASGVMELAFIHSYFNWADLMMKAQNKGSFTNLCKKMLCGFRLYRNRGVLT